MARKRGISAQAERGARGESTQSLTALRGLNEPTTNKSACLEVSSISAGRAADQLSRRSAPGSPGGSPDGSHEEASGMVLEFGGSGGGVGMQTHEEGCDCESMWSAQPPRSPGRTPRSEAAMKAAIECDTLLAPPPYPSGSPHGSPINSRFVPVSQSASPYSVEQMPHPAVEFEHLRLDNSQTSSSAPSDGTEGKYVSEEYVAYFRRRFGKVQTSQRPYPQRASMGAADIKWPSTFGAPQASRDEDRRFSMP
mmetsp:Transcript_21722/g.50016  ORF Transcript_21722/g.50016 Transcript_21722/m.50016 type:complete len:252 (+) Transcript_21722:120-875(+)